MLILTIPDSFTSEAYDEINNVFVDPVPLPGATLELEHSLFSLSKWESTWEVPFLGDGIKTTEQTIDYVRCMTLTSNVSPEVYARLNNENVMQISSYIDSKMTATWFKDPPVGPGRKEIITAEVIYYWMVALSIPFECQHWHLNRLLTLVKVCNKKNAPEKKMGKNEMLAHRRKLNEERRAKFNTQG